MHMEITLRTYLEVSSEINGKRRSTRQKVLDRTGTFLSLKLPAINVDFMSAK